MEHADPVAPSIPFSSSLSINDSPSIPENLKCALFGSLFSRLPFTYESLICVVTFFINASLISWLCFIRSSNSSFAICAAFPNPTIPATFSVPDLSPFS